MVDTDISSFVTAWPYTEWGTFSLGTSSLAVPSIPLAAYNSDTNQIYEAGQGSYEERVWIAGWGKEIVPKLFLGLDLKTYHFGFNADVAGYSNYTADGYDLDAGLLWHAQRDIKLGLVWRNMASSLWSGGGMQWSTGAHEPFDGGPVVGLNYSFGFLWPKASPLNFNMDYEFSKIKPLRVHTGLEYWLGDFIALRAGFITGKNPKQQALFYDHMYGVGLKLFNISVDYAYYPNFGEEVDPKHFLSLSSTFDLNYQQKHTEHVEQKQNDNSDIDYLEKVIDMEKSEDYGPFLQ